jgi:hypothetical protein
MYIYSLHPARNRLAREGEELVVQRLDNGSLAFISVSELEQLRQKQDSFWADLLDCLLLRTSARISVVSIPPGAHLLLRNVPSRVQESLGIAESQEVVLTAISGRAYSYRDALILPDQTKVLVQDLCEGIEATVLCLSSDISAHQEKLLASAR